MSIHNKINVFTANSNKNIVSTHVVYVSLGTKILIVPPVKSKCLVYLNRTNEIVYILTDKQQQAPHMKNQ